MTAVATIGLHQYEDERELARWGIAAAIVLAAHIGLAASYLLLRSANPQGSQEAPAIIIELAPLAVAPASPLDIAPGPEMQEAQPPPEPEVIKPPPAEDSVTATPVEPPKPKPPEVKREQRKPPAPRTTAAPRSERDAAKPAAPQPGSAAASAAMASWRDQLVAHLQRYKQYPGNATARREEGVVSLAFSMDRNGRVLSRHIARSSGFPDLDEEVLSMIQRAQPLPAFPPSMPQSRIDLTVPIRFSLR
jgi:protein TonB